MKTTSMTITVNTENNDEQSFFTVEFLKENLKNVLDHIDLLVKPSDVYLCEEMGVWEIK